MSLIAEPSTSVVYQEFLGLDVDHQEQLNSVLENVISLFNKPIEENSYSPFLQLHAHDVEITPPSITIPELISQRIERDHVEEPFYVVNLAHIEQQLKKWHSQLPRVQPYYAVKCNPDPMIVELLASLGANFDCASVTEIDQVLSYSVDPSRIIFANPCKAPKQIRIAHERGVNLTTFDNSDELLKIKQHNPEAKVVLRIVTDDSHSVCRFSSKFGAQLKHVPSLLLLAQSLGLDVVGVSFHVGSGCMCAKSFSDAIINAKKVFDIAESYGISMTLLDLGGGFPGVDRSNGGVVFSDIAAEIHRCLDEQFPESTGVKVIAEPGRYFVAGSHTLAVQVYARRNNVQEENFDKSKEPEFLYYVTDGVYGSFNCIIYDHAEVDPILLNPHGDNEQKHTCTIFGPTCDSMDCIAKNIDLPQLEVGDWLFFKDMGAYTTSASTEFNGFKRPFLWYIYSGSCKS